MDNNDDVDCLFQKIEAYDGYGNGYLQDTDISESINEDIPIDCILNFFHHF